MFHLSWLMFLFMIRTSYQANSPISPRLNYSHSKELKTNVAYLWWTVNEINQNIIFELHVNTTGWIALGISQSGGMKDADIGVGWVYSNGTLVFQDRYATGQMTPTVDTTSTDWFALSGSEQNGWTAIQFKRLLDTCDTMDVPITSGTNRLIYAYGLIDPFVNSPTGDITKHFDRGSVVFSLRSYADPPLVNKFSTLDTFEFRLNEYTIPAVDTTYYCQVFKAPSNYTNKRHVIAYQMLINNSTRNMVHHVLLYECISSAKFNDSNLPQGECDSIHDSTQACPMNIAIGWAVGGELIEEFPPEAGYPIGVNLPVKYYMLQMHYDNPNLLSSQVDNSGLRFFVTDNLRLHDLGFLTFGTGPDARSLTIPPGVSNFVVDAYCPVTGSQKFPSTGLTIISAFPHTHLQGKQVWTKLIRNGTAIDYLFNAESYDFNYQMNHRLAKPIQVYPGDEFLTRCVYNTANKTTVTLGGERTRDEMCLNMFAYYPRVDQFYACISIISPNDWAQFLKKTPTEIQNNLDGIVQNISWTSDLKTQWQTFYAESTRIVVTDLTLFNPIFKKLPQYNDLKTNNCTVRPTSGTNLQLNPSSIIIDLLFAETVLFLILY